MQQLKLDCALLEACGVMDYSLLLGVHYRSSEGAGLVAGGSGRRVSVDGTVANFEEHDGAGDLEAEVERVQVGGRVGGWVGGWGQQRAGLAERARHVAGAGWAWVLVESSALVGGWLAGGRCWALLGAPAAAPPGQHGV
jgi:hypothetical protein